MNKFIYIPSFIIFLFTLHKLVKDDHVFLRRNVKTEIIFDVAFLTIFIEIILDQFKYFQNSIYLTDVILGAAVSIFIFGKVKKIPLGRIYDFFTLSFIATLPFLFFINIFFSSTSIQMYFLIGFAFYLILAFIFLKKLFKKLTNRSIKEGYITIYFFIIYSVFSLGSAIFITLSTHKDFVNFENIYILLQFLIILIIFVKQKFLANQK